LAPILFAVAVVAFACGGPVPASGAASAATAAVDVDEVSLEISALM